MDEKLAFYCKEEDKLMINYLMLLQAILFSDYDDGQVFVVCLYDTKENDRLVAVFNNDARCARFFGTTKITIQKMRCRNSLIKGRFRTERFECGTTSTKAVFHKIMMTEGNRKEFEYIKKKVGR